MFQRPIFALELKSFHPPLLHLTLHYRELPQGEREVLDLRLFGSVFEGIVTAATARLVREIVRFQRRHYPTANLFKFFNVIANRDENFKIDLYL